MDRLLIRKSNRPVELMPRGTGKSVMMRELMNAHLDAGHRVLVISKDGMAIHKRHAKHKHITIITPVQRQ